jgi:sarcosine oxidase gamma subunit
VADATSSPRSTIERLEAPDLSLTPARDFHIGALRYFDRAAMDVSLGGHLGGPLPGALAAMRYSAGSSREVILAWRSPTETYVLARDAAMFAALVEQAASNRVIGYLIDQTGGVAVSRLEGGRARDLLCRLGSVASVPARGEARISRIAELPVLVMSLEEGAYLLTVERVYSEHLMGWVRETLADF